ncbi:MAG: SAM-dependent methyltransferase [Bacteroidetes bacterium]|nr:MAG: SAM-dependent methyltransferase [Bacteroidota bacterium]
METKLDYIDKNRDSWNKKTEYHINSDFYDMRGFMKGKTSLNQIELALLGDIKNKSLLHLQCHFGQDTLSLARMGAKVTGIDLSDKAIESAIKINNQLQLEAEFICCDIYDLPNSLNKRFDIVFTSYGTIGWLPDMDKWAKIVSSFLKPEGKFVFAEFHPVVWMFDDNFSKIAYNYFNDGPIEETFTGTYADKDAPIEQETVFWNHGMSEVINSLITSGLEIKKLNEYDYSPYNCFNQTKKIAERKFRIKHLGNNIPMVYAVVASKKEKV